MAKAYTVPKLEFEQLHAEDIMNGSGELTPQGGKVGNQEVDYSFE